MSARAGGGAAGRAGAALQHVNLLLVLFAGACLATGARLRWDPTLYAPLREVLPQEYRVLAAAVPSVGAALLALAHLALVAAAPAPSPRTCLLYTYAGLTSGAVALELGALGWVAARVAEFSRSAQAQEMQELLATRHHLQPLLDHLAKWHPLPERLAHLIEEVQEDLPWNGYLAAGALGALLLLQALGVLLALVAACAAPRRLAPRPYAHAAFSASRASLVHSLRSSASSRSGASVRSAGGDERAPLRAKYKNGRIVPV